MEIGIDSFAASFGNREHIIESSEDAVACLPDRIGKGRGFSDRHFKGDLDEIAVWAVSVDACTPLNIYMETSQPEMFDLHPSNTTVKENSSTILEVSTKIKPVTYEWANITTGDETGYTGVNTATLTIPSAKMKDNGALFLCIVTFNECPTKYESKTATLSVTSSGGINGKGSSPKVLLYPNPAKNELIYMVDNFNTFLPYSISDMNGKNVMDGTITGKETHFDISTLAPGLYLFKAGNSQKYFTVGD